MKRMELVMLAMLVALVPGIASAVLIEAIDFTGGPGSWDYEWVADPGYAATWQLYGDPTKIGYVQMTGVTGQFIAQKEIFAPAGFTMSNVRL